MAMPSCYLAAGICLKSGAGRHGGGNLPCATAASLERKRGDIAARNTGFVPLLFGAIAVLAGLHGAQENRACDRQPAPARLPALSP